ncbi:MAG TPA: ribose-5-phosphate isomerase RpiA [Desulfobacterales bacterium]|nr:ribose-5-phosphate isomerase RpiA [Desulfobacterales bacterium]
MENQDRLKEKAARHAVESVKSGMVLGLGTGSTVAFALKRIGQRLKAGQLTDIAGIPTSLQTEKLARELGIPLATFEKRTEIDLTIDGADEVDPRLNLIKGGGGALLREKVVAQASRRNIIIVDDSKYSLVLGTRWPLPVEVIPFAWPLEADYANSLGARVALRKNVDGSPFTTDQGNYILDCDFGPIPDPDRLAIQLSRRAGILEHGLFLNLATEVIVAGKDSIRHLKR